ncbi:P-type conjugative transfer protein TrbL [Desulfovibrio sp. OttesenSCG-928-F07]|nr:P-type conjugative transfer protein TrbL [Desulfovibrio sp. OttesenSCG-928-F07]
MAANERLAKHKITELKNTHKVLFNISKPLKIILALIIISCIHQCAFESHSIAATTNNISTNLSLVDTLTDRFLNESTSWAYKLEDSVKKLFYILFTLEITMLGITALLKKQEIEDIILSMVSSVLFGGFILVCITNYAEWSNAIMSGMSKYSGLITRNNSQVIMEPLALGFEIFNRIMEIDWGRFEQILIGLVALAILISFAFITLNIIYIKCEAFVAVGAGFILLGFGGCHFFKDYAINLMRYILSVGFKLYVLYMVLGLGFNFIMDTIEIGKDIKLVDLSVILITALIILTLSKSLPDVAAGIINGAHVNTGGAFMSTAKQVMMMTAAAAAGTAAAGAQAKSGIDNLKAATNVAKAGGATTFGGVAKGAFDALRDARKQVKADTAGPTVGSKLEAMKQSSILGNSAGDSAAAGGASGAASNMTLADMQKQDVAAKYGPLFAEKYGSSSGSSSASSAVSSGLSSSSAGASSAASNADSSNSTSSSGDNQNVQKEKE